MTTIELTLDNARTYLLSQMVNNDHWEGELASSALSTAVATFALTLADDQEAAQRGRDWLCQNANADGGWGDTVDSPSNLTTTLLSFCAVQASLGDQSRNKATLSREQSKIIVQKPRPVSADAGRMAPCRCEKTPQRPVPADAETWLTKRVGGMEPTTLHKAILACYGDDKTFSAPILTMCALANRLGDSRTAWQLVPQLPFELALLPHRFFQWVHLPVVSYALPALIAVGLVRHTQYRPPLNPLNGLRSMVAQKTLTILRRIQPASGGFLEAAPLTGFVAMSLIGAGYQDHPATQSCLTFLRNTQRSDGSWPIDTNLATWLTSLSVRALGADNLSNIQRNGVKQYLTDTQSKTMHPFTHAEPGGWPWTHLSGGVPDADDTSAALLALDELECRVLPEGITWLLDLQNSDGGIATFCRGWGKLPFDRSCPDITAHALEAWVRSLDNLPPALRARTSNAIDRGLVYLIETQRYDGAWIPLWFGNQNARAHENPTYGTARVVVALTALNNRNMAGTSQLLFNGQNWLLKAQNIDGGWGGDVGLPSSIEETALAVRALGPCEAAQRGAHWLVAHTRQGTQFPPAPIGFYFASLWYSEKLYPVIFTVDALTALLER